MNCKSPATTQRGRSAPPSAVSHNGRPPTGMYHTPGLLAVVAATGMTLLSTAHSAYAGSVTPITDKSFFNPFSRTTITFENHGDGSPVQSVLSPGNAPLNGEVITMPTSEYSAQGLLFQTQINWVNDGNGFFDGAQMLGGSPTLSIPSANIDQFTLEFTVPVKGFGFFIAHNPLAQGSEPPTFVARDASNNVIGSVTWNASFVDGTLGGGQAEYGFMGLQSDTLIKTVTITKRAAILDDLIFSPIPSPGALGMFTLFGLAAAGRRSRSHPTHHEEGL